jgi:autotransporter-associated beta strand protein
MEDGSGLEVDIGTYDPGLLSSINTPTFNANGNYVIDLTGVDIEPGTITVLTYGAKTGSGMPSVGNVPPGLPVSVTDTGSAIVLTIDPYVIWSAGTGDWDTVTSNWTGNTYTEGDAAVFPDLAGNNAVTLTADRSPSEVGITILSPNTYTFTGSAITGAAGVVKTGSGIATFENANSYAGPLAIQGGAVVKTVADTTTGDIAAANNASLALSGGITTGSGQTFTFTGPGLNAANLLFTGSAIQRGAIQSADGNNTWAGDISFSGSANNRLGVQDGTTLNLSGNITESAPGSSLAFRHGNTAGSDIIISGTTNNWTGTTDIFGGGGALKLGANNALPTASVIRVGNSSITGDSTFDLNGFNQTCAGLTQVAADTSFVTNSGSADSTLTILSLSDQSFGGVIQDGATHKTSLVKDGTFSQTLTAASTYTGATTIDGGTLALGSAGSIASSATVAIDEDATLDASAKTTFVLEAAQPLTLRIDAGTSGKIKATELDIQNAQVTLDVVASGEPVYILAEYTSLVGTAFASVNSVPGYEID